MLVTGERHGDIWVTVKRVRNLRYLASGQREKKNQGITFKVQEMSSGNRPAASTKKVA